jgi:hypothetical protein
VKKKHFDWENYQKVGVTFWVVKPFDTMELAQAFLAILDRCKYAPDQVSTAWTQDRYITLHEHLDEYYRAWLEVPVRAVGKNVMLRRTNHPRGDVMVLTDGTGHRPFDLVWVNLEADYFRASTSEESFVQLSRDLYDLFSPAYGMLEFSPTEHMKIGTIDLQRGLPGIFWGNFLGPEYTAMFGWDRLDALRRELPIIVEHLRDDGVLILLDGQALDSGSPELLARAEAVERFLGSEYFAKTSPSQLVKGLPPVSFEDIQAGRVPSETLRKMFLPSLPPQGKVPGFRFQELRRQRQVDWERSGGMTVEEIAADLGLELKGSGAGGMIVVDATTGRGIDLPEETPTESEDED